MNGAAQINGNLNITGTLSGGGFSVANWAQFPAIANVALGFSTITNGFVSNVATTVATAANFTTSRPVFFARTDTGIGQADPASFNLWHGVYVKHTGSANDQTLSLYATGAASGWTITCRDDFYGIGIPLTFTTGNFTVNATGNMDLFTNYATLKGSNNFNILALSVGITGSNGIALVGNTGITGNTTNSGYLSNGGILSNTVAAAFFQNTSNTGTLGVAGVATHTSNILQTAGAAYLSNAGIFSNASNVILSGGASSYFSNTGILSNTGAAAYFQNTSNTGTLGVAGIATLTNINQNLGNTFARTFGLYYGSSPFNSDLFITANMATTTADALTITGATYDSASYGAAAIRLLTTQNGGLIGGVVIAASATVNTVPVNVATISASQPFKMDVNGTSRGAIYYSSVASAVTITPGSDFGVYYNLTASGSYTITVAGSQATSNIGKFYLFRNNSGGSLSVTFTGGTGITSPITISSNASATIVVTGTGGTYALF